MRSRELRSRANALLRRLQVLKREAPYAGYSQYALLAGVTLKKLRPSRPDDFMTFDSTRLITWAAAERCWSEDPLLRPSMTEVVRLLTAAQPVEAPGPSL